MYPSKILIIVQRSNGDVLLASPLIHALYTAFDHPRIDLLINDDTLMIAKALEHIHTIHLYSYQWRRLPYLKRIAHELKLLRALYQKYDLSISLTASDRSVLFARLAAPHAISAVEEKYQKSWWKKKFLTHAYLFNTTKHILENNTMPLQCLGLKHQPIHLSIKSHDTDIQRIKSVLKEHHIDRFLIFHPLAQYQYKMLHEATRNALLAHLSQLKIPIIVTGGKSPLDHAAAASLPALPFIYNFIAKTTLGEYIALSSLSLGYVGMDTLNMHIASAQNKKIFAIFGPTLTTMWAPWDNTINGILLSQKPCYTYGNITLFRSTLPCVPCGKAGCNDAHGPSECLETLHADSIFKAIQSWLTSVLSS